jgi:hypothetical protein
MVSHIGMLIGKLFLLYCTMLKFLISRKEQSTSSEATFLQDELKRLKAANRIAPEDPPVSSHYKINTQALDHPGRKQSIPIENPILPAEIIPTENSTEYRFTGLAHQG